MAGSNWKLLRRMSKLSLAVKADQRRRSKGLTRTDSSVNLSGTDGVKKCEGQPEEKTDNLDGSETGTETKGNDMKETETSKTSGLDTSLKAEPKINEIDAFKNLVFEKSRTALGLVWGEVWGAGVNDVPVDRIVPLLDCLGVDSADERILDLTRQSFARNGCNIDPLAFDAVVLKILKSKDEEDLRVCIRNAFKLIDFDGDGFITESDVIHLMRQLDIVISDQEVNDVIATVDEDRDGKIGFRDFKHFLSDEDEKDVAEVSDICVDNDEEILDVISVDENRADVTSPRQQTKMSTSKLVDDLDPAVLSSGSADGQDTSQLNEQKVLQTTPSFDDFPLDDKVETLVSQLDWTNEETPTVIQSDDKGIQISQSDHLIQNILKQASLDSKKSHTFLASNKYSGEIHEQGTNSDQQRLDSTVFVEPELNSLAVSETLENLSLLDSADQEDMEQLAAFQNPNRFDFQTESSNTEHTDYRDVVSQDGEDLANMTHTYDIDLDREDVANTTHTYDIDLEGEDVANMTHSTVEDGEEDYVEHLYTDTLDVNNVDNYVDNNVDTSDVELEDDVEKPTSAGELNYDIVNNVDVHNVDANGDDETFEAPNEINGLMTTCTSPEAVVDPETGDVHENDCLDNDENVDDLQEEDVEDERPVLRYERMKAPTVSLCPDDDTFEQNHDDIQTGNSSFVDFKNLDNIQDRDNYLHSYYNSAGLVVDQSTSKSDFSDVRASLSSPHTDESGDEDLIDYKNDLSVILSLHDTPTPRLEETEMNANFLNDDSDNVFQEQELQETLGDKIDDYYNNNIRGESAKSRSHSRGSQRCETARGSNFVLNKVQLPCKTIEVVELNLKAPVTADLFSNRKHFGSLPKDVSKFIVLGKSSVFQSGKGDIQKVTKLSSKSEVKQPFCRSDYVTNRLRLMNSRRPYTACTSVESKKLIKNSRHDLFLNELPRFGSKSTVSELSRSVSESLEITNVKIGNETNRTDKHQGSDVLQALNKPPGFLKRSQTTNDITSFRRNLLKSSTPRKINSAPSRRSIPGFMSHRDTTHNNFMTNRNVSVLQSLRIDTSKQHHQFGVRQTPSYHQTHNDSFEASGNKIKLQNTHVLLKYVQDEKQRIKDQQTAINEVNEGKTRGQFSRGVSEPGSSRPPKEIPQEAPAVTKGRPLTSHPPTVSYNGWLGRDQVPISGIFRGSEVTHATVVTLELPNDVRSGRNRRVPR